jgi:cytochrome c5
MKLPLCPNYRDGSCERSEIRVMGEHQDSYLFTCACCHLLWAVSKPRTQDRARWENSMKRVQKASELEREQARRPRYSIQGVSPR